MKELARFEIVISVPEFEFVDPCVPGVVHWPWSMVTQAIEHILGGKGFTSGGGTSTYSVPSAEATISKIEQASGWQPCRPS